MNAEFKAPHFVSADFLQNVNRFQHIVFCSYSERLLSNIDTGSFYMPGCMCFDLFAPLNVKFRYSFNIFGFVESVVDRR